MQNPVAFPSVNTTYTVVVNDGQTAVQSQVSVAVVANPAADAGSDDIICENTPTYTLSGSATNFSYLKWTTQGDGTFNNTSIASPTYTPGTQDKENGSVVLTLHAFASPPCTGSTSDQMVLSIASSPVADAGADIEICENENVSLSGDAANYSSVTWSSNGDGYFTDISSLQTTYIPAGNDFNTGNVLITLTANASSPCVGSTSDNLNVTIMPEPLADAGVDDQLCEGSNYSLSGDAENFSALIWTTAGDGNFQNPNQTNAVYLPGSQDIQNGEVQLSLTATGNTACGDVQHSDQMTLEIFQQPQVNAGTDVNICENQEYILSPETQFTSGVQWSSSGDGSFDDNTLEAATYAPGPNDISNGAVTLTITGYAMAPCTGSITDEMTLTFIPGPVVNAGSDEVICVSETLLTSGTSQEATNTTWTSSGDGSFADAGALVTDYTPGSGDIENGSVYLTLTGTNESCSDTQDSLLLTIQHQPDVNAGEDEVSCFNSGDEIVVQLDGTAANYGSVQWNTNGEGVFADPDSLSTTYTFQGSDIENQEVILTLTAYALSPCPEPVSDDITIAFDYNPVANAGADGQICEGDTIHLDGTGSNYYSSVYWFRLPDPEGQGEFIAQNSLEAQYVPSIEDVENGGVSFRLQVQNLDCSIAYDTASYNIQRSPAVDAGADFAICRDGTAQLNATVEFATGIQWNTLPGSNGSFNDSGIENPVYTPGSTDISNGIARLVVSGWGSAPCDVPGRDTIEITINEYPTVDLGNDIEACSGSAVDLTADAENFSTFTWSTSGDGSFSVQDIGTQYELGQQDAADGQVTITFTAEPDFPCSGTVDDQLIITVKEGAAIEMDNAILANYNESYTFEPQVTSNSNNLSYLWEPQNLLLDATALEATTVSFPVEGDSTYLFELFVTNEDNGCVNSDTTRVYLDLGDISINLAADPAHVCEGGTTTLYPNASGGTGTYEYFWQADPGSWTSDLANPVVSPDERTTYTVIVSDEFSSPSANITIDIKSTPSSPSISGNTQSSQNASEVYTTSGSDIAYYDWWARNGSVTEGQGTKSATIEWGAAGTGVVYMRMASEFGCYGDTSQMTVSIGTVSLEEFSGVEDFRMYPNPAEDYVMVEFTLKAEKEVSYSLYDSRGIRLHNKHLGLLDSGQKEFRVELNSTSEGIYLLHLNIGEHQINKRILKLR